MSSELVFSEAVDAFVATSIRSIEELEVLLAGRALKEPHTVAELSASVQIPPGLVAAALENLVAARVFVSHGGSPETSYEYAPATAAMRLAVDELARASENHRVEIIMLISSKAIERVRSGVLQMFGDSSHEPVTKKTR